MRSRDRLDFEDGLERQRITRALGEWRLTVLDAVGDDGKRQSCSVISCGVRRVSVGQYAGKFHNFRDVPPAFLAIQLDVQHERSLSHSARYFHCETI